MISSSGAKRDAVAVLMAVYQGDEAPDFVTALNSVWEQRISLGSDVNIYLAVDGPIPTPLDNAIQENSQKIFRILRSETCKGLGPSLNGLIAILDNEQLVFRMDSDDISLPDRFRSQAEFLKQNPDIDILGTAIVERNIGTGHERVTRFSCDHEHALRSISWRTPVAHPTVCFRKSVLTALNGYPDVPGNEDIAMWFKCMKQGFRFGNLQEPHLIFRVSDRFWKRRSFRKATSELRCYVSGLLQLEGVSPRIAMPFMRYAFRMAPPFIAKILYSSGIRR